MIFSEKTLLKQIHNIQQNGEDINILTCVNDKFVNPMINLMFSIRHFCNRKIKLFVLSTGLTDVSKALIKIKMDFLGIDVEIKVVDLPPYEIYYKQWSLDVYLKVFGFHYLPKEINKVLYLDSDMLACDDISQIYDVDLKENILACSIDVNINTSIIFEIRRRLGIKHDYFNSGMLLMNLEKQRKIWSYESLGEIISKNYLQFPDQDLLNLVCEEKDLLFIPFRNNFQAWWELKSKNDLEYVKPVLIHYILTSKPWDGHYPNEFWTKLFFECAKLTGLVEYS